MNALWLMLPGIIYLGLITSYTDLKFGKIKNRDVLIGAGYAVLAHIGIFAYSIASGRATGYIYFIEMITNALFALAAAFGLWNYKVWSAGDGKLFFAFALLIPPEAYVYGRQDWIPSVSLLFNVFIIGLAAMVFLIAAKAKREDYRNAFVSFWKKSFASGKFIESLLFIFAGLWVVDLLISEFSLPQSLFLRMFLTLLLFFAFGSLIRQFTTGNAKERTSRIQIAVFLAVAVLRLIFDKSVFSLEFFYAYIFTLLVWILIAGGLREALGSLGKSCFSKQLKVSELKPGMIVSGDKKLESEAEGLSAQDIARIKKSRIKTAFVSSTIPFAPFIFAAAILSLIVKGNILIVLSLLF